MRSTASILTVLLLLGGWIEADGYTPRDPPTPRSCRTACQGKGGGCLQTCVSFFSSKPWRERLSLEEPRTRGCLEQERACVASKGARCLATLQGCVWRVLGLARSKMQRCWATHNQAASRCQRHEGKSGWSCRNQAEVALHGCRKRALARPLDDDSYRVLAAIEEDLGRELGPR